MPTLTIQPPPYDAVAAFGIGLLALLVAPLFVWLVTRGRPAWRAWFAIATIVVMAGTALLAWTGHLVRFDVLPPPMALLIVSVLAMGVGLGLSPIGAHAARNVPLAWLVGLQAFRLPLELVMHRAYTQGIMPVELSYSGYNFDVITGGGAALLYTLYAAGVHVPRVVAWLWNLWGCWCLAVITFVAVATSPLVQLFGTDPAHVNTWVLFFPYVWLPAVLVTIALAGHVIVTRALLGIRHHVNNRPEAQS